MTLAQWSNLFVYAAMAVYTMAFVAFASSFAASRAGAPGAVGGPVARHPGDARSAEGAERRARHPGDARSAEGAERRAQDPSTALASVAVESVGTLADTVAGGPADGAAQARAAARLRSPQIDAEMAADQRRSRWGRGGSEALSGGDPLPPGRRSGNIGMSLTWLAFLLLLAGIVARAMWAHRAPWGNMYEYSLATALAITGVFLLVSLRRDVRWMGLLVTGASLVTLGIAVLLLYNDSPQLVPALKSYWLVIHVSAAIIAGGAFTVGAAATVLYLIADRAERDSAVPRPPRTGFLAGLRTPLDRGVSRVAAWVSPRVPDSRTLDALSYRVNAFVFPLWTFAVVAGSIWAEDAWGRYWGWDPKETWAFITWLVYAGYLHARATAGWRGRRAAVVALIGFACFLINFFGVNLFASGLHSYSGV